MFGDSQGYGPDDSTYGPDETGFGPNDGGGYSGALGSGGYMGDSCVFGHIGT